MEDSQKRLKYRLIESSTEDPDYPLFELIRGAESSGWMSVRFCTYPQEILIQFLTPVHLKQIQFLSNEKKIASLIEIHCYYPSNSDEMFSNYKQATFEKLGYIRMDTNSKTNYKAREFRKVYVDTCCLYLKLVLQKNYLNKYNVFNQVGLISIDFYGSPIAIKNNELYLKESLRDRDLEVNEEDMDEIAQEKLKILKNQQDEALKIEDYDEAKRIKRNIDKVKLIGKKIFEMETNKKIYVNNEDFDNAKIMKLELERLRSNLKYMNRQLTTILPYQNSTIELNRSISNEETKENKEIENINIDETVNKEKSFINEKQDKEQKDKELSFSIEMGYNQADKSIFNKTNKSLEKIDEEFLPYEEQIIPAIKRRLNMTYVSQTLEEFKDEALLKGELDDLDPKIRSTYELFIKYIGENGLKKLFSKNILWKDEGLVEFNKAIPNMLQEAEKLGNEVNLLINLIMKMVHNILSERHPQACIRSIEVFETLLNQIKKSTAKLNYDFTITDRILLKINEKVGDVNSKVRNRAVMLYSFMLKQDFCDYNNLLSELIEDEMKKFDIKKIVRSSKMILGKLSIFQNVFEDFDNAVNDKRTDKNSFPFILIATYVIENINHSKSEVRKLDREVIIKMYNIFGFKKLEPLFKKVEEKELEKLLKDIPEIKEIIEQNMQNNNTTINIKIGNKSPKNGEKKNRERSGSRDRKKSNDKKILKTTKSLSPPKLLNCSFCAKFDKKFNSEDDLKEHVSKECVMFTNCIKCKENIEIRKYNNHMLNECANKDDYKNCKRCKEAVDIKEYEGHVKENKCNPAKNPNSSNRCPLCHKDLAPQDKGFIQHLVKDICQKQKRRDKVVFVNGK